jgi:hypothetical protein
MKNYTILMITADTTDPRKYSEFRKYPAGIWEYRLGEKHLIPWRMVPEHSQEAQKLLDQVNL